MLGMQAPEQMYQRALLTPEATLVAVLQGKSADFPQDIAFAALKHKRQMQTAVQGEKATQQLQGVAALPANNMDFAGGGIVAFNGGGFSQMQPERVLGRGLFPQFYDWVRQFSARVPEEEMQRRERVSRERAAARGQAFGAPLGEFEGVGGLRRDAVYPGEEYDAGIAQVAPPAAAAPAVTASGIAAAPRSVPKSGGIAPPTQPQASAVPPLNYEEPTLSGVVYSPQGEIDRIRAYEQAVSELSKPEREARDAAVKARREKVEGGKGDRLDTARGQAALRMAGELLQGGRGSATSRGEALKAAAGESEKFVSAERKLAEKLDDADIALTESKLALKDGDVKLGATLMDKAQARSIEAAKVAGTLAYQRVMAETARSGLSIEERKYQAQLALGWAELKAKAPLFAAQASYYGHANSREMVGAMSTARGLIAAELKMLSDPVARAQIPNAAARMKELTALMSDPAALNNYLLGMVGSEKYKPDGTGPKKNPDWITSPGDAEVIKRD